MLISECKFGENVTLRVTKGDRVGNFDLPVKVLNATDEQMLRKMFDDRKKVLVLEPLRVGGKVVNLVAPGMRYDLIRVVSSIACGWKSVKLSSVKLSGKDKVIAIYTGADAIRIDRRRSERLPVGAEGNIIAQGKPLRKVVIRDVSIGGVGIVMPKNATLMKGSQFRLEWDEKIKASQGASEHFISVPVKVARITPLDAGHNVVGLRMMQYDQKELGLYLQQKTARLNRKVRR